MQKIEITPAILTKSFLELEEKIEEVEEFVGRAREVKMGTKRAVKAGVNLLISNSRTYNCTNKKSIIEKLNIEVATSLGES